MRLLRFRRHPISEEDLSAYVDGRLPASDKQRVDAHLQVCVDCGRKLEETRSFVAEMRRLPEAKAPRSFAISPELAAAARREASRSRQDERTAARRVYLGLSGATVAAAVLLVAVLGIDLAPSLGGGGGPASSTGTYSSVREAAPSAVQGLNPPEQADAGSAPGTENFAPEAAAPPATAVPDKSALSPNLTPLAKSSSGEGATTAQRAQPSAKETRHLWLWIVEGAAGGLIIGCGASAFWMRRRWIQINRS